MTQMTKSDVNRLQLILDRVDTHSEYGNAKFASMGDFDDFKAIVQKLYTRTFHTKAAKPPLKSVEWEQNDLAAKPVAWRVGVWGDGSTPYGRSNIFCDEHEATIVANIATHHAEVIVAAHNAALSELAVAPIGSENAGQPQQRDAPQALIENVAYICGQWEKNQGASSLTIAVRLLLAALDNDKEQRND